MSILKKPYEVAVYDDILIDGIFQEKRLGIIGSDKMMSQNRILEPNLVRNVNGQNKFSFKMYKRYTDTITGEKVYNPFVDWLISERKVKLKYEDKWYDFIVKDINENSADYLYTYQLEDANVQELSKNGFGITLDADLMNNIGDSVSLGSQVMTETDWQVDGDVIVEQVDEALVYVTIPAGTTVIHLYDQTQDATGNYSVGLTEAEDTSTFTESKTVLAFYSSCTNKPHRFQFIYSPNGYNKNIAQNGTINYSIGRQDDRIINEKDCQYYVDFGTPETEYKNDETNETSKKRTEQEKKYGVYLPNGWALAVSATVVDQRVPAAETLSDSQVSSWYRGKRYGFAHQSVYVPLLERYCQKYVKNGTNYLGYVDTTYVSPTTVQNYISGYNFESNSGWTATSDVARSGNKRPEITNFYGRYNEKFISITDDFLNGSYNESNTYTPYMEMTFYENGQYILNSCIRDNRTLIGNLPVGQELVLDYNIKNSENQIASGFTFQLGEYNYNTTTGGYNQIANNIEFDTEIESNGRIIFKVKSSNYNEKTFKKDSKIFLKIIPPSIANFEEGMSYYIEKISLYKKCLDKQGNIIIPDYEAEESNAVQNWIDTCNLQKEYKLFPAWSIGNDNPDRITEKDSLIYDTITTFDYNTYKPVYNIGGAKIRTVTAKESNYFNILQTIAETFEQWLVINIDRNDDGSIKPHGKKVSFKNYRGDNNYACFRYGVNLKDIQRTNSSKNIVTKLIVKQNANELAENGFCTIQRAGSNPTGENYIYDFQYYHNTGIMDPKEYLTTNYYLDGAMGEDINEENTTTNLNGYFIRLKQLNNDILPLNQEIIGLQSDLVSEKAKLEVAKNTIEAATQSIATTREDFRTLTGLYPEEIQEDDIASIAVSSKKTNDEENYNPIRPQQDWFSTGVEIVNNENENKFRITSTVNNNRIVSLSTGVTIYLDSAEKNGANYIITKLPNQPTGGLYLDAAYEKDGKYRLEYVIEIAEKHAGKLTNIALHSASWKDIKFEAKDSTGTIIGTLIDSKERIEFGYNGLAQGIYSVTIEAVFKNDNNDEHPYFYIQPNKGLYVDEKTEICIIKNISLKQINGSGISSTDRTAYTYVDIDITVGSGEGAHSIRRTFNVPCKVAAGAASGEVWQDVTSVDNTRSDVQRYITEYTTYKEQLERATNEKNTIEPIIAQKENTKKAQETIRKKKLEQKTKLNQLFFQCYSRFIQEGTWINEEYVDDEKYFVDAQSVLHNSCYPQVAYNINVLELSQLPGYELFKFELGDKTWAIDDEFFGEGVREEVIITELNENLDDPSKNQIKVQNFKNQFQDLFQKITATVQQTQYNSGSYEKGNALLEASAAKRNEFVINAINDAASFLAPGKSHDVVWDESGITVTEAGAPCNQVKIVGGAILLSAEDPTTKEQTWITGLTNQGISANLITAGRLNTGEIQIMSGDDATFKWDTYGLSAYDTTWYNDASTGVQMISGVNTKKFVRFDKNGIYGINNANTIDGKTWHPTGVDYNNDPQKEIDANSTFALTWDGLKVTGNNNVVAKIGKQTWGEGSTSKNGIIRIYNGAEDTFTVDDSGNVSIKGDIIANKFIIAEGADTTNLSELINSFDVQAGSIAIYDTDNPDSLIFGAYKDFEGAPKVEMAGWNIDYKSISKGKLGQEHSFLLSSIGQEAKDLFGSQEKLAWSVGVGENFGITSNGELYSIAGKIANWSILEDELRYGYTLTYNDIIKIDNPSNHIDPLNYAGSIPENIREGDLLQLSADIALSDDEGTFNEFPINAFLEATRNDQESEDLIWKEQKDFGRTYNNTKVTPNISLTEILQNLQTENFISSESEPNKLIKTIVLANGEVEDIVNQWDQIENLSKQIVINTEKDFELTVYTYSNFCKYYGEEEFEGREFYLNWCFDQTLIQNLNGTFDIPNFLEGAQGGFEAKILLQKNYFTQNHEVPGRGGIQYLYNLQLLFETYLLLIINTQNNKMYYTLNCDVKIVNYDTKDQYGNIITRTGDFGFEIYYTNGLSFTANLTAKTTAIAELNPIESRFTNLSFDNFKQTIKLEKQGENVIALKDITPSNNGQIFFDTVDLKVNQLYLRDVWRDKYYQLLVRYDASGKKKHTLEIVEREQF